jgi:hypothetical protein
VGATVGNGVGAGLGEAVLRGEGVEVVGRLYDAFGAGAAELETAQAVSNTAETAKTIQVAWRPPGLRHI